MIIEGTVYSTMTIIEFLSTLRSGHSTTGAAVMNVFLVTRSNVVRTPGYIWVIFALFLPWWLRWTDFFYTYDILLESPLISLYIYIAKSPIRIGFLPTFFTDVHHLLPAPYSILKMVITGLLLVSAVVLGYVGHKKHNKFLLKYGIFHWN